MTWYYVKLKQWILLPYKNHNEETNYLYVNSDHPTGILKQLPMQMKKRLSSLSSSKEIFLETTPYYEQYLSNREYRENLNYRDPTASNLTTKSKRQRNKFHKIFNRTSLKLSYSCMPNIKTKINTNNREILRNTSSKNANHCNWQPKHTSRWTVFVSKKV